MNLNTPTNLSLLEQQLSGVKLSYTRQISLSGNPRYDPKLTFELKKDIEWLEREISSLEQVSTSVSGRK